MAFAFTQLTSDLDQSIMQELTSTGVSTPLHDLGHLIRSTDGREYMYVKFDNGDAVAAVAGAPCVSAQSEDAAVITSDTSESGLHAMGIFLSILTDGYYGWIQTLGRAVDAPCTDGASGEVAAGDPLGCTVDSLWTKVTVGGTTAEKAIARMAGSGGFATIEIIE